jgi:hypothetical protein
MDQSTTLIVGAITVLFGWLLLGTLTYLRSRKQLFEITKGVSKKDLKTILGEMTASMKASDQDRSLLRKELHALREESKSHFQKLACVRFNPFADTGGNQSFSLCLLDDLNNGIVITSLHSRDSTRIYTKEIKKGICDGRELSKEEHQALKLALKENK